MVTTEQVVAAYESLGTQRKAAEALGCAQSTVSEHLSRARGTSTLYGPDGREKLRWIKTGDSAKDPRAVAAEILEGLKSEVPIKEAEPCHPLLADDDIMVVYPVGDHHLGMLSWAEETGHSYDLTKGKELLARAIARLCGRACTGSSGLLIFLGDFLHYDSLEAVTPKNRNLLDTDSRFHKIARTAVELMRLSVQMCLLRHKSVRIIIEPGNHDPTSSILLMEALAMHYDAEPRVTVDTAPGKFHYCRSDVQLVGLPSAFASSSIFSISFLTLSLTMCGRQPSA